MDRMMTISNISQLQRSARLSARRRARGLVTSAAAGVMTPGERKLRAFTLVELLAVIAIAMTLVAVGLPALRGWRDAQTASAASGQILAILKEARSMAITQDRPAYVVVSDHSSQLAEGIDPAATGAWRAIAIYQQQADPALPPRQVTRWYRLPEGCSLMDSTEYPSFLHAPDEEGAPLFSRPGEEKLVPLPYLAFNASGGVLHPARSEYAQLWLQTTPEARPGQVSVALFTGRPSCVW